MIKFLKNIFLVSFIFLCSILQAQITKDDCFVSKNEKVYVQLAKDVLASGESLIYKAFLVNASDLKVSDNHSKILYFELSDNNNKRILFWRNNVNKNGCSGQILIPDTLKGGIYNLRAYTNWMRNFDKSYYFRTNIIITSLSDKKLYFEKKFKAFSNELEIYPEGGKILLGVANNLTVKFNSNYGSSASIVNQAGEVLSEQKLNPLKIANLNFTPQINNEYAVIIKDSLQNIIIRKSINTIEYNGKALCISEKGNEIFFTVKTSGTVTGRNHLIIRNKGRVQLDTLIGNNLSLSFNRFTPGILHAIIVNEKNEALSQTLFYNRLRDPAKISLTGISDNLKPNMDYKFSLAIQNIKTDETFNLSFFVSSYCDVPELHSKTDMDLYFNCFSELANGFYYQDKDTAYINEILAATAIDQYLWGITDHRNKVCEHLMEDKAYILQGKITDRVTGLPVGKTVITLSYPDSIPQLNYTITDSAGNFSFLLKQIYDNKSIFLQLPYADESKLNVKWEFDNKNGSLFSTEQSIDSMRSSSSYVENYRSIQLVNAIYNNGLQLPMSDTLKAITMPFYYEKGNKVNPGEYLDLEDFKEIADNLLMGLSFKAKNNNYSINLLDPNRQSYFTEQATVFLNGVIFTNLDYISRLGSKEIFNVELVKSQVLYSDLTFYGLVLIRTKDGKVPAAELNDLAIVIKNEVSPEFSGKIVEKPTGKNQPDFRTLLLFNNNLSLKKDVTKEFSFSSPILKGDIEFKVQGISSEGRIISYSLIKKLK